MTKNEFLKELQKRLKNNPKSDIKRSIEFYNEMIDDLIEDGADEEAAVDSLGAIDDIVEQIQLNRIDECEKNPAGQKRKIAPFHLVIFICAFPVWLILLIVFIVMWVVLASLFLSDLAMLLAGIYSLITVPFILTTPVSAAANLGWAMVLAGCSILLFFALVKLMFWYVKCTKWFAVKIKMLITKEDTSYVG